MKLLAHHIDTLVRAASYGSIRISDLVAGPKRTAKLSKTYIKRCGKVRAKLTMLSVEGWLEEHVGGEYAITERGKNLLRNRGYDPREPSGVWTKFGAELPRWAR